MVEGDLEQLTIYSTPQVATGSVGIDYDFKVVETKDHFRLMVKPEATKDASNNPLADVRINIVGKDGNANSASFKYAAYVTADGNQAGIGEPDTELTIENGWYVMEVNKADYQEEFGYIAAVSVKTAGSTEINWMYDDYEGQELDFNDYNSYLKVFN